MTSSSFKRVSVIGLGYIGLPTAAMFASRKVNVIGVDVNQRAVDTINRGEVHIVEPDLDIVVRSTVKEGLLKAATKPQPADAFLIAVPTPFKGNDKEPDLSYVEAAAQSVAPVLARGNLVVLESTSPVGTTEVISEILAKARPDLSFPQSHGEDSDVRIAYCPERVLPGRTMHELISNDRIIGGMTNRCSETATKLYKIFVSGQCIIASSPRIAEMCKLTENSFRDVNIAFANELSLICDRLRLDVWELISLANRHPRVNILQPGPGVGGHCIAVDPWFIVSSAPDQAQLVRKAREVNDHKPDWVLEQIRLAVYSCLSREPKQAASSIDVTVYGLSFKPDVADLRESPALKIVQQLASEHTGTIYVIEPHIAKLPDGLELPNVVLSNEPPATQVSVLLVDHSHFKQIPKPSGLIIDTKGIWANEK